MKSESILSIFEANEKKIVRLYQIYRRRFPLAIKTWGKLCEEEKKHVNILQKLREKYPDDSGYFLVSRHAVQMVSYVVGFVKNQFDKKNTSRISLNSALETALRIERSMIEKKYFSLYQPKIIEIRQAFRQLNHDVERHINILLRALRKYS